MRYQGKLVKWYDDKGFGFIRATIDSKDVFLHISEFQKLKKRPAIGELLTYEIVQDNKGRFRAVNVSYLSTELLIKKSNEETKFSISFLIFFLIFTCFIVERSFNGFLSIFFPLIFIGSNLVTFLFYYQDKTSAIRNDWRTPESTLHMLSLLGGWGAAYLAQKLFRHKHKKMSFMLVYKITIILNCLGIIFYAVPDLYTSLLSYF